MAGPQPQGANTQWYDKIQTFRRQSHSLESPTNMATANSKGRSPGGIRDSARQSRVSSPTLGVSNDLPRTFHEMNPVGDSKIGEYNDFNNDNNYNNVNNTLVNKDRNNEYNEEVGSGERRRSYVLSSESQDYPQSQRRRVSIVPDIFTPISDEVVEKQQDAKRAASPVQSVASIKLTSSALTSPSIQRNAQDFQTDQFPSGVLDISQRFASHKASKSSSRIHSRNGSGSSLNSQRNKQSFGVLLSPTKENAIYQMLITGGYTPQDNTHSSNYNNNEFNSLSLHDEINLSQFAVAKSVARRTQRTNPAKRNGRSASSKGFKIATSFEGRGSDRSSRSGSRSVSRSGSIRGRSLDSRGHSRQSSSTSQSNNRETSASPLLFREAFESNSEHHRSESNRSQQSSPRAPSPLRNTFVSKPVETSWNDPVSIGQQGENSLELRRPSQTLHSRSQSLSRSRKAQGANNSSAIAAIGGKNSISIAIEEIKTVDPTTGAKITVEEESDSSLSVDRDETPVSAVGPLVKPLSSGKLSMKLAKSAHQNAAARQNFNSTSENEDLSTRRKQHTRGQSTSSINSNSSVNSFNIASTNQSQSTSRTHSRIGSYSKSSEGVKYVTLDQAKKLVMLPSEEQLMELSILEQGEADMDMYGNENYDRYAYNDDDDYEDIEDDDSYGYSNNTSSNGFTRRAHSRSASVRSIRSRTRSMRSRAGSNFSSKFDSRSGSEVPSAALAQPPPLANMPSFAMTMASMSTTMTDLMDSDDSNSNSTRSSLGTYHKLHVQGENVIKLSNSNLSLLDSNNDSNEDLGSKQSTVDLEYVLQELDNNTGSMGESMIEHPNATAHRDSLRQQLLTHSSASFGHFLNHPRFNAGITNRDSVASSVFSTASNVSDMSQVRVFRTNGKKGNGIVIENPQQYTNFLDVVQLQHIRDYIMRHTSQNETNLSYKREQNPSRSGPEIELMSTPTTGQRPAQNFGYSQPQYANQHEYHHHHNIAGLTVQTHTRNGSEVSGLEPTSVHSPSPSRIYANESMQEPRYQSADQSGLTRIQLLDSIIQQLHKLDNQIKTQTDVGLKESDVALLSKLKFIVEGLINGDAPIQNSYHHNYPGTEPTTAIRSHAFKESVNLIDFTSNRGSIDDLTAHFLAENEYQLNMQRMQFLGAAYYPSVEDNDMHARSASYAGYTDGESKSKRANAAKWTITKEGQLKQIPAVPESRIPQSSQQQQQQRQFANHQLDEIEEASQEGSVRTTVPNVYLTGFNDRLNKLRSTIKKVKSLQALKKMDSKDLFYNSSEALNEPVDDSDKLSKAVEKSENADLVSLQIELLFVKEKNANLVKENNRLQELGEQLNEASKKAKEAYSQELVVLHERAERLEQILAENKNSSMITHVEADELIEAALEDQRKRFEKLILEKSKNSASLLVDISDRAELYEKRVKELETQLSKYHDKLQSLENSELKMQNFSKTLNDLKSDFVKSLKENEYVIDTLRSENSVLVKENERVRRLSEIYAVQATPSTSSTALLATGGVNTNNGAGGVGWSTQLLSSVSSVFQPIGFELPATTEQSASVEQQEEAKSHP